MTINNSNFKEDLIPSSGHPHMQANHTHTRKHKLKTKSFFFKCHS